jgi:hypothetical protein
MRIHTDRLTKTDIYQAAAHAGGGDYRISPVRVDVTQRGSRSAARAFDVYLFGTSTRRPNNRGAWRENDDHAATWDEYGIFLAELFKRDPWMTIPRVYESAAHFHWATSERFETLTPEQQHGGNGHKWVYAGGAGSADNSYSIHMCQGCDAEKRVGGWSA